MRRRRPTIPPAVQQVLRQVGEWATEHERVTELLREEADRRKEENHHDGPETGERR